MRDVLLSLIALEFASAAVAGPVIGIAEPKTLALFGGSLLLLVFVQWRRRIKIRNLRKHLSDSRSQSTNAQGSGAAER